MRPLNSNFIDSERRFGRWREMPRPEYRGGRDGADKVLTYMLDHCATSFDDQKVILELALADTRGRIFRREQRKMQETLDNE